MKLDTPCIGICSTVYGDDICRGCKRTYAEIITWNTFNDHEKQIIYHRLATNIVRIMENKIEITHSASLIQGLKEHSVRYNEEDSHFCWAYHLLRTQSDKQNSLEKYGILIKPLFQHYTPRQLFTLIDKELWDISQSLSAV
jgi:predicted Fe-S protein YdhL (DUF1289 family)